MEDTIWDQRRQLLTSPTTNPPILSQFFISTQIPCCLDWDYPPILGSKDPSVFLRWTFSLHLKRVSRLGLPETSWRSNCPYQQLPPLFLAKGVEDAQWWDEQRLDYVRKRLTRKRVGNNVHPLIHIIIPDLFLFSLLQWNPFVDLDPG